MKRERDFLCPRGGDKTAPVMCYHVHSQTVIEWWMVRPRLPLQALWSGVTFPEVDLHFCATRRGPGNALGHHGLDLPWDGPGPWVDLHLAAGHGV